MKALLALWMYSVMLLNHGDCAPCEESASIHTGGSERDCCNLTLRPESTKLLSKYQTFLLRKPQDQLSNVPKLDCEVVSVNILENGSGKRRVLAEDFASLIRVKDDTTFELRVYERDRKRIPSERIQIAVELKCGERNCIVTSPNKDEGSSKYDVLTPWLSLNRKLLSLKSKGDVPVLDKMGPYGNLPLIPIVIGVASVLVLVIFLTMCASCSHNETPSDEVCGSGEERDENVVAISHIKVEDNASLNTPSTNSAGHDPLSIGQEKRQSGSNEDKDVQEQRRSTSFENGRLGTGDRTASTASTHSREGEVRDSLGGRGSTLVSSGSHSSGKSLPHASASTGSVHRTFETSVGSQAEGNSEAVSNSNESTRASQLSTTSDGSPKVAIPPVRLSSGSLKTDQSPHRISNDSPKIDQSGDPADQLDGGRQQHISNISKKRLGSDKENKEAKRDPGDHDENKHKFWRRKPSKNKKVGSIKKEAHVPKQHNAQGNLSDRPRVATPPTNHHEQPHRDLPLPPPPPPPPPGSSRTLPGRLAMDLQNDEAQYETVDTRTTRRTASVDMDTEAYATVEVKTRYPKYDEVVKEKLDRKPFQLYASVEDDKSKRVSTSSDQYDIVEFTPLPNAIDRIASTSNPERCNSTGSDLYEVVTDDVKIQSGVMILAEKVEDDYATVDKDTSQKRISEIKPQNAVYAEPEKGQEKRILSGEVESIPQPPPVSSLKHVTGSVHRRTYSEGDELHSDSPPYGLASGSLEEKLQTTAENDVKEYTYAMVDKSKKTRRSVDHSDEGTFISIEQYKLPERFNAGSDTPPPLPPSLYAELARKEAEGISTLVVRDTETKPGDGDYDEITTTSSTVIDTKEYEMRLTQPAELGLNRKSKETSSACYNDYEEVATLVQKTNSNEKIERTSRSSREFGKLAPDKNDGDSASGYYDVIESPSMENPSKKVEDKPLENHLYDVVNTSTLPSSPKSPTKDISVKHSKNTIEHFV